MFIEIQTVPLLEQIEQSDRKGEPHLEIRPNSLAQMFQFANLRKQRENRLDQHSIVPLAAPTQFQILRLVDRTPKAGVRQNNCLTGNGFDERHKSLIRNVRRFDRPVGHEPEFVDEQTKLAAHDPFPRSKAFLADPFSVWLMVFTNRVTKFDAVRIDHTENGRFSQKLFGQPAVRFQTPKKACAFWQSRKQVKAVLAYPAIKLVLRTALQSEQQAECDKFTDRKFRLNVFGLLFQHIVYAAKKFCDKVFLSHGIGFLCKWFRHQYSRNFSVTFSTSTNG
jgi:hypothetical protein